MNGNIKDRILEIQDTYGTWKKQTIWGFFQDTAKRYPEKEFLVAGYGETYTYYQSEKIIRHIAEKLASIGVKEGTHVAVQASNTSEAVFLSLAIAALHAVKVSVHVSLGIKELNYVLTQSKSQFLITCRELSLEDNFEHLKGIVILRGGNCEVSSVPVYGWIEFLSMKSSFVLPENMEEEKADCMSDIIYTSGSTSAPKGVMLTHDMLMRSALASCINRGFETGRRVFIPLPMFHVYGYVEGLLTSILAGGTVLIREGKFEAESVIAFMKEQRANDILSVPAQMMHLVEYLDANPCAFPDLHAVYCSASLCPSWLWSAIREKLGVQDLITGYGMSEVCGATMQTEPFDGDEILRTRVGKLLPGGSAGSPAYSGHQLEYKVVDQNTLETCKPGENGELWCRGLVVTTGYFERPEINAHAFTEDGWFRTGDCGHFDENGYLILAGRLDEVYKINGENVSPKFIENIMGNCPEVKEVAILGIPDDKHGYVGVAYFELYEDCEENRQKVENYCKEHLAKFQIPKHVIYLKEELWPRTSTGKIQKFRLKEMVAEYIN